MIAKIFYTIMSIITINKLIDDSNWIGVLLLILMIFLLLRL